MDGSGAVPCVDLRDVADADDVVRSTALATLLGGLRDTGFVRVVGHAVEPALIARVHGQFERFFALDPTCKRRVGGVAGGQRGHTPFGVEHARDSESADLKEFFHVGQQPSLQSGLRGVYPPNVWPAEIPELRESALTLYRALERTAANLLRAIAAACSLPEECFASMIADGNSILRAACYPPVADASPVADALPVADAEALPIMRAAPHEDINLITLLCGATDAGLELRTRAGEWVEVPSNPDEIVADVGDMLARITNGWLPSTTHRVVARGDSARRHRYSLPFFAHPRPDCDLSVMAAFVTHDGPAQFAPITAQAFLDERLREIGLVS